MKNDDSTALRALAGLCGVLTSYTDVEGRRREASPESLLAVLKALDPRMAAGESAKDAARERRLGIWRRAVEPVLTAWNGRLSTVTVRLPESKAGRVGFRMELESGEVKERTVRLDRVADIQRRRVEGIAHVSKALAVGMKLPSGYHKLTLDTAAGVFHSVVFAAPEASFSPPAPLRTWGVFAPLHALHERESWGAGDFGTMERFMEWIAAMGGGVAAALPLLPAFLDEPFEFSPYSPVSRLFWNEFYVDVRNAPEFEGCARARAIAGSADFLERLETVRAARIVDYREAMGLKRRVLEAMASGFFSAKPRKRWAAFRKYLGDHPLAADYAAFRAATERRKQGWPSWPERMREGDLRPGDYAEPARQFHLYAQWLAHEQIEHLSRRARDLGSRFYLDLPLGVNGAGYDVWRRREFFATEASGGAPPDSFFTKGQDWGFAPLHPERLRERGYSYVIDYIRHHLRQTRMLRIDHFMGVHRLYWVPRGMSAAQGAYVRYRAEELHAILSIESHRHEAVIVGENLGTVPPEVNREMKRRNIRQMFVVQYEQRPDALRALRAPPRQSVASLNTHDMPPFHGWLRGDDIDDRIDLGLISRKDRKGKQGERRELNLALAAFLRKKGCLRDGDDAASVLAACLNHLSSSKAEVVLITLEDLWLETAPQNVPGTNSERVNWRRKTRFTLEEIRAMPQVIGLLKMVNSVRATNRKGSAKKSHEGA